MSGFIFKMFIGLLSSWTIVVFSKSLASNSKGHIKCISLDNQPCQVRTPLVDNNYNETLFYSFTVSANKCGGSCNISMIHMLDHVFQINFKN